MNPRSVSLGSGARASTNSRLTARPNIGAKEDLGSGLLIANARNFPQEKTEYCAAKQNNGAPVSARRVPYDDDSEEPCLKVQAEHVNTDVNTVCSGGSPYPIRRLSARATVWGTTSFKGSHGCRRSAARLICNQFRCVADASGMSSRHEAPGQHESSHSRQTQ